MIEEETPEPAAIAEPAVIEASAIEEEILSEIEAAAVEAAAEPSIADNPDHVFSLAAVLEPVAPPPFEVRGEDVFRATATASTGCAVFKRTQARSC